MANDNIIKIEDFKRKVDVDSLLNWLKKRLSAEHLMLLVGMDRLSIPPIFSLREMLTLAEKYQADIEQILIDIVEGRTVIAKREHPHIKRLAPELLVNFRQAQVNTAKIQTNQGESVNSVALYIATALAIRTLADNIRRERNSTE